MKPRRPVVEGYFEERADGSAVLVGGRCDACGAYFFPKRFSFCRNPGGGAPDLADVELSTRGTLWSFTDNRYAPPPPYPAAEPFEPYGVAAVALEAEQMVVLGQLARGTDVAALHAGQAMELCAEDLYETDDAVVRVWKWRIA
ncbi:MAG: Zn-ribbon domain-containing OB-fold protein [Actinomycetota bacterium]